MQRPIPCQPERSERSFWDEAAITASAAVATRLLGDMDKVGNILRQDISQEDLVKTLGLPGVIGVAIADTLLAARRSRDGGEPEPRDTSLDGDKAP